MLSKRYESTEVDRRTWLHVPSGTHKSTSSDTRQVVENKCVIQKSVIRSMNLELIIAVIVQCIVQKLAYFLHISFHVGQAIIVLSKK